ncbi:MAG: Stk1 family PASTA domain-containing Ser/Thr kinase [Clostridia bacterium]|nr:Stk1 family PASTA domain-containing Ser/Thr kinase [Clostridia bacterium]MBR5991359.1 Stk1 family PASTA domain-containing Ser/Thr kinase [Clostridia bacterium]MBR6478912.1 Stk1 family PASTA domain-containing Ser/Thr kinase [Clostridia bacterium]MBR6512566.1 Stk1 family PASTA domain-containing Ser/Thr kinase [Clostridia bacterium]
MDTYVGKRLDGRYEIREIIGVGGMAVVYKAYDNIDDRIVAIKILKEEYLANEEFRRRFKNESKAIAVLSHPNIVKVYDVSFGDRLQYIVMEYIEGITLKEYIEQQKVIPWKEAVHFTTQILRALQHAHDKGIVHRDVKPQNIMLLQNGNIKVTDFGIARFSRGETRTMTESAIGSVHYISPEQARGEITDDKADIYSVGVVLYEMITGRLPFESDSAVSVAIMQLQNEAVHPRDINPQIPIGLEQITLRAMQKNAKDRYQSAAEMLLDLDEFKRNPAVKFDYSYFVDKEPTQFINRGEATKVIASPVAKTHAQPVRIDEDDEFEDDDDYTVQNRTLPILVGVASALLAVIVLIVIFLAIFTDIFKNDKIEVPDLLGKDYAAEVEGNKKYTDWEFDVKYVTSTDTKYQAGQICKQSPYKGAKAKKGSVIKIEVVSNGSQVEIPEVNGLELGTAKQALIASGFVNTKVVPEYTDDYKEGLVISTEPAQGTKTDTTTTIIINVAAPANDNPDLKEVPSVIGLNYEKDKSDVEEYFSSVNLHLGTVKEEDSKQPAGTIISQSIDPKEKVPAGTKIDIVVSTGKAPSSKATISFKLPVSSDDMELTVYVDNELVATKRLSCDGSTYKYELAGSGEKKKVICKLDGQTAYTATVDFTEDPANITNVTTPEVKTKITIPATSGTAKSYKSTLERLGFKDVVISGDANSAVERVSPEAGTKAYATDKITIYAKESTTNSDDNG